jgi:Ca2+-binding EF-hand superfamily protein
MKLTTSVTLASLLAISLPALAVTNATPSVAASSSVLASLDPDHDGTVDLNEAKTAASAVFDKLEKDKDGTLDMKELHGRLTAKEWAVADPDNDKTISKEEYVAYVEALFKQADPDGDGTLDAKELHSRAGEELLRLVK